MREHSAPVHPFRRYRREETQKFQFTKHDRYVKTIILNGFDMMFDQREAVSLRLDIWTGLPNGTFYDLI